MPLAMFIICTISNFYNETSEKSANIHKKYLDSSNVIRFVNLTLEIKFVLFIIIKNITNRLVKSEQIGTELISNMVHYQKYLNKKMLIKLTSFI